MRPEKSTIACLVRQIFVEATPEELVRQKLLTQMVNQLGYPLGFITVEKELRQIPHLKLSPQKIPNRRADIICFAKGIHPAHSLYPLLMIECKATHLTKKVINQVMGYNTFVQSLFITIANDNEVQTGWCDYATGEYTFIPYLPSYADLTR